jgi:kinetochore protein Nuf2
VFAATDELEFPALHDDSIPARAFQEALAKLLLAAGVKDFSLRDLYKPEAATLRRNLSAIINFAKFREEKLVQQTEQQEHCEALILAKEAAEAEAAALQATLAELQAAAAAEVPEVAAVEAETAAVFAENQSLNKAQSALGGEVRALKQQANALTDEASQLRYKLSQARGAGEDLRAQIVQSPHKLQAQLEEISAAVERERGALLDAERRSRDLAQRLDAVSKVERDVAKAEAVMGEAEAEVARKKEVSRRVKALRAEVAAAEHEAGQLEAQHQHLKRQQAALAERIHRLEAQQEVKRQAAEGRVEEALRNKEAIAADNAAAVAKLAENEAMVRASPQGDAAACLLGRLVAGGPGAVQRPGCGPALRARRRPCATHPPTHPPVPMRPTAFSCCRRSGRCATASPSCAARTRRRWRACWRSTRACGRRWRSTTRRWRTRWGTPRAGRAPPRGGRGRGGRARGGPSTCGDPPPPPAAPAAAAKLIARLAPCPRP